ncbi:MAG TPA: hypothetical protein VG326_20700 [Tepidisphaeraceae bacterium]|jgi:hypothetical protein|nr:hypothetical protein [Tepidisphaeraceae bacterium]
MKQKSEITSQVTQAHQSLRRRVLAVASAHRRSTVAAGTGRLIWWIGIPLLAILILQIAVGLPFYLRVPVIPLLALSLIWLTWRLVLQPLIGRYTVTQAALLVESARPHLSSKLVSALECYHDLQSPSPRFDGAMVAVLVTQTASSTASDDFTKVIDRRPMRRQLAVGGAALVLWLFAFVFAGHAMADAFRSLGSAWADVRNIAQKAGGAGIVVESLDCPAYLRGSDIAIHAHQHGFHANSMQAFVRATGEQRWKSADINVDDRGRAEFVVKGAADTFEIYFASSRIESDHKSVVVTERPRIANLSVEYDLPDYAHHAPITQPRSDGNLEAVFGTTVIVTIRCNKPIKSAELKGSFLAKAQTLTVGGEYARAAIRLADARWLKDGAPSAEKYFLALSDEYGYGNDDAGRPYNLVITKDQPPKIAFIGLPHRSIGDEPHLLEARMNSLSAVVRATDDFGVSKLTIHYRVEDLDTGKTKTEGSKEQLFPLPRVDIPQAVLLRFAELGAVAGDRVVFWAEAEDAYDLEQPAKGAHHTITPTYRIAVVSQEEAFNEVVYKDDWSTQWYDALKVATLTRREIPPRQSPEREPAAVVAKKLLDAPQNGDSVQGADRQLVQDYFDSLNVLRPGK